MRPFAKIKDATDERLVDIFHLQVILGKASERRRRLVRVTSNAVDYHGLSQNNVEFCFDCLTGYILSYSMAY